MCASNYNWVCFDCRSVKRQPKTAKVLPVCPSCGDPLFCLGYKVEVPARGQIAIWRRLRDDCRERVITRVDQVRRDAIRTIHVTEREIVRLRALGPNKDRQKQIKALQERIVRPK